MQCAHEPLYDVDPRTGTSIEVFDADRAVQTFGRGGAGWFWWARRRGCAPDGPPTGPFATSFAAYWHAMKNRRRRSFLMNERFANRTSLSMCHACDMEQPTHEDTRLESIVFTSIS